MQLEWTALDPCVIFANRLACAPGFAFGPRVIREHQLLYVAAGRGTGRIQSRSYTVAAGDLFYYGPDIVHAFEADQAEPFVLYGLHFALQRAPGLEAPHAPPPVREAGPHEQESRPNRLLLGGDGGPLFELAEHSRPGAAAALQARFDRLVDGYERREEGLALLSSRAQLVALLVVLAEQDQQQRHRAADAGHGYAVRRLQRLLEERAALPYDREWLSEATGYHAAHAARLLRAHTGRAPHDYHNAQKLARARQLLRESELPITAIAEQLHYSSIHYFSKAFKLAVGVSPLRYRELRLML
ncbi:helix-turn-helix transcriptional regulator [Paenibacillus sp. IB182496]|uniref:Helix-turn-helix transcriptional regulator n=1 Tax=Paenibacillus sabuli TaxID=2772509 RepID=A0A927BRH0_9BACL|nr:AraC family transcriptional regulator [Paenibacillus sabuli]MBD2844204.1 helix-turn-helix transcriptional regulator [Paenibacillus sabuli]